MGCVSPPQRLHPHKLLVAAATATLVLPAALGPHGVTSGGGTVLAPIPFLAPAGHGKASARCEHWQLGRWGLSTGSCFAGDIKYDEAMGYPMVQHWRVRSNLYRVKLSSITLSAGEGFWQRGDARLCGWVVVICPRQRRAEHLTCISHLQALLGQ